MRHRHESWPHRGRRPAGPYRCVVRIAPLRQRRRYARPATNSALPRHGFGQCPTARPTPETRRIGHFADPAQRITVGRPERRFLSASAPFFVSTTRVRHRRITSAHALLREDVGLAHSTPPEHGGPESVRIGSCSGLGLTSCSTRTGKGNRTSGRDHSGRHMQRKSRSRPRDNSRLEPSASVAHNDLITGGGRFGLRRSLRADPSNLIRVMSA